MIANRAYFEFDLEALGSMSEIGSTVSVETLTCCLKASPLGSGWVIEVVLFAAFGFQVLIKPAWFSQSLDERAKSDWFGCQTE